MKMFLKNVHTLSYFVKGDFWFTFDYIILYYIRKEIFIE